MRFLPTRVHGVIDYLYAVVLIALPFVWGPAGNEAVQWVIMAVGLAVALYSLLTRYELGLLPLLPMRAHLALDMLGGLVVAALPWLLGFSAVTWVPYLVLGVFSILAGLVTRTDPEPTGQRSPRPYAPTNTR